MGLDYIMVVRIGIGLLHGVRSGIGLLHGDRSGIGLLYGVRSGIGLLYTINSMDVNLRAGKIQYINLVETQDADFKTAGDSRQCRYVGTLVAWQETAGQMTTTTLG